MAAKEDESPIQLKDLNKILDYLKDFKAPKGLVKMPTEAEMALDWGAHWEEDKSWSNDDPVIVKMIEGAITTDLGSIITNEGSIVTISGSNPTFDGEYSIKNIKSNLEKAAKNFDIYQYVPENPVYQSLSKATSVAGSSHDKNGPYGGVSNYNDKDVDYARGYMQNVLGVQEMEVNGRALEHILAEVFSYGGGSKDNKDNTIQQLRMQNDGLKSDIIYAKKELIARQETITKYSKLIEDLREQLQNQEKYVQAAKKIENQEMAVVSTGRRIKE